LLRTRLAVTLHQGRLVVEEVELRRRPDHVQVDEVFRTRGEVRLPRRQRVGARLRRGTYGAAFVEQVSQGRRSEAKARATQKMPASPTQRPFIDGVHGRYPFVIVSSRFNRTVATASHAANSRGVQPEGTEKAPLIFLKPPSKRRNRKR